METSTRRPPVAGWRSTSSSAEEAPVSHPFTLTLSCQERPGIVRAVTSFLFEQGCDIVEHQQFDDAFRGQLFLRTAFVCAEETDAERLSSAFGPVAEEFGMTYEVTGNRPQRV